jgi:MioC protein
MRTPNQTSIYAFLRSVLIFSTDWLLSIFKLQLTPAKLDQKSHDYTQLEKGCDYIFESIDGGRRGYMTGQGKGIKPGEYFILSDESDHHRYQVKEIDYYSNPSDIWIALLERVD